MRIQFDPKQSYQLDAIRAVTDLFDGQQAADSSASALGSVGGLDVNELGYGNVLDLSPEAIRENLIAVRERNHLETYARPDDRMRFTVEMETGTGKTYVYLRTIFELRERYGWSKFCIIVPSVAIREGVISSIRLMGEHLRDLYGSVPFDSWVYDSAQASRLRSFATSSDLQILVINIQAFQSTTNNVIHQDSDRMNGHAPVEFLRAAQPILILDEPQKMSSPATRMAIEGLGGLFELHYSATHREVVNPVYRLNPVQAYDLGLVKRIEVSSVIQSEDFNRPYLKLIDTTTKPRFAATIELDVDRNGATRRTTKTIRSADVDLVALSGGREQYQGYIVDGFDGEEGWISFTNGIRLRKGEAQGVDQDLILRTQIRETISRHLVREAAMQRMPENERMKVLSLFFIDRVANYAPADGKIRKWFVEEYEKLIRSHPGLGMPPVERVHDGYFAQDRDGARDSRGEGTTEADRRAYELIMQKKEELLSREEPLQFLFSHSALKEGWDNPNVFQICTLRESGSEMERRQQIGRGLRLPVQTDGTRCTDRDRCVLTVIASERFESFARALQSEIQTDCGVEFEGRIKNARDKRTIRLKDGWDRIPEFRTLWGKVRQRTRYRVSFSSDELVDRAAVELAKTPDISKPRVRVERHRVFETRTGVSGGLVGSTGGIDQPEAYPLPDMLSYLQARTDLTRTTLANILIGSGKLAQARTNPQQFLDLALGCIRMVLQEMIVDGIEYVKSDGDFYDQRIFEEEQIETYAERVVSVRKSIFDAIALDSNVERKFAVEADILEGTQLIVKLPSRFKVETPLGTYNPDWAMVWDSQRHLCLVRETKGTLDPSQRRSSENAKIQCGKKHFEALGVDFATVTTAREVAEGFD